MTSAASSGSWSTWKKRSSSAVPRHFTGALPVVPRGSNATRSNCRRRASGVESFAKPRRKSTADTPGPPGLTSIDPIRRAGLLARILIRRRLTLPLAGAA
jgi:hypothetical protein